MTIKIDKVMNLLKHLLVISPSLFSKQLASITIKSKLISSGCITSMSKFSIQLLLSVTVKVYIPENKFSIFEFVAPLFHKNE